MHLVPGARASSRHFSPSRVKKVIARAFSTADDLRLQKSFYGSKTEQQLLGHSLRTAFVNFVVRLLYHNMSFFNGHAVPKCISSFDQILADSLCGV